MKNRVPPKLRKFPAGKQRRMDELLDKNSEGQATPQEVAMLRTLVAEAEELMAANAKLLGEFAKSQKPAPPSSAVPVTVWIQPHTQLKP